MKKGFLLRMRTEYLGWVRTEFQEGLSTEHRFGHDVSDREALHLFVLSFVQIRYLLQLGTDGIDALVEVVTHLLWRI